MQKIYDCGFTRENKWFRYRAAASIIEQGGSQELHSNSYTRFGDKENMHWIPIDELDQYKAFPSFLKAYLNSEHSGIEHIVTDERTQGLT